MIISKRLSKEELNAIRQLVQGAPGIRSKEARKLLSDCLFHIAALEGEIGALREFREQKTQFETQTKNVQWLNDEYKKLQSQLSQKDEAAQAAHKVWNERLREKDALIEKMRDCLNVIASWGEGPRVNGSFDEPYSSKKARECLNEISGNSGEGKGERGPMTHCIKCGGYQIAGPFYKKDQYGAKSLQYVCRQCGYSEFQPTLDDEERREITAKQLAAILIKERK